MKIDIVIPFKDAIEYIEDICLDLELQTDTEFSVCFVSDDSSDGTLEYLKKTFIFSHKVITSTGVGPGAARNTGIKNTFGDYILFIDADDRIEPNYVESFKSKAQATAPDVIECMYIAKDIEGNKLSSTNLKEFISNESRFIGLIEGRIPRLSWGKAYKRSYLTINDAYFPDGVHNGEDHIFLLKFYQNRPAVELIIKSLYFWIRRSNSLTNRPAELKTIQDFVKVSEMKSEMLKSYLSKNPQYDNLFIKFARRTFKEARALKNKIISDGVDTSELLLKLSESIQDSILLEDVRNIIKEDKGTTYWDDVMKGQI
ncbi:TPA: glycosyltransferase [Escherichia coli]|uniref:glycosyltransferase family 2 protein n=1 Tax=Enterobacteriaceae TaxID=543 RepID=UPI000BE6EB9F|nr:MULTISPECIES: glycosyltransferase family 2 protein [Enterobacteriaceae]EFB9978546.1 glycosyltransferase [Escherichia coli]EFC0522018.1 glycosyltransferase [Escherichia coli]EFC0536980.1 glycosyltransferase [Escherichia coli]EFC0541550.1 glycosyltransferase [Escherichia coli]EFC0577082.1 glycosyltransferase [Escherichia coli]